MEARTEVVLWEVAGFWKSQYVKAIMLPLPTFSSDLERFSTVWALVKVSKHEGVILDDL